ncbi:methyltransferase domain-containing protein [Herbiconiux sp. KACC 21604]|uniref:methyltransferase domain-containing protein n=1 Tax=unclassified Herbiconiux TaxID=2618217 RepID=UPI001491AA9D|nr:methyltransferase domain-containing protein [Herbiconiux sp. SALV-R1]QJU54440.1 methyltransferase domain-containing protein [Herbiconiux sp. SALV-R1]WPO85516.1 methyltransferase domain-containing protein [Herbiconiux sp. KACC 21604]
MSPREQYTHGHHESVLRSHTWRTVENSAAYLAPRLAPGLKLLDVGSGPGTITVDFARRLAPGGSVTGVDASAEIVAQAAEFAAAEGVTNVTFDTGDAYALDFDDDTFDIVHAHQVLQHLADPVAALREFRRVTKPGGVVAARDVDYGGAVVQPPLPGLVRWGEVYDAVHRSNGGDPWAGRALKGWALDAGFTELEVTASVWCFASDEERAWWGGLWADRSLHSAFAPRALEIGAAGQVGLEEISAAWREWAETPSAMFLFPHMEIIATV